MLTNLLFSLYVVQRVPTLADFSCDHWNAAIIINLEVLLPGRAKHLTNKKTRKAEKKDFCWFESEGKILEIGKWQL
jgi:hypothetical protein